MNLSEQDAKLFFDLMWSLQFYVKQRLNMLPEIKTPLDYAKLAGDKRMEVRNAVWENPQFIADYARENPDRFTAEEIAIISSWQHFVRGTFFIERLLQKHAIFIGGEKVYAVLGLYDPLEELFDKRSLPVYCQAVLLPFRDVIVYDGLISSYPVFFGGGVKGNLKEAYNRAKQRGEIIVSLGAEGAQPAQSQRQVELKDWGPQLAALAEEAKALRAQPGSPPSWGPAFSLVKASIEMAQTAVSHPQDTNALWEQYNKLVRALNRLEKGIDYS
jgi:hypothetical protein